VRARRVGVDLGRDWSLRRPLVFGVSVEPKFAWYALKIGIDSSRSEMVQKLVPGSWCMKMKDETGHCVVLEGFRLE
jgi:hypothetical protein